MDIKNTRRNFSMPKFFALPPEVKQRLVAYFDGKPVGTKIKYGFTVHGNYILKNSYIKLEKDVYALGRGKQAIVGTGAFGKVKYIQSLSSNSLYVVKMLYYKGLERELNNLQNELSALYDLGLYRDEGTRARQLSNKQYIVMLDAGMSLDKCINPKLNNAERYDLAIKLCWSVHNLHCGNASRTGTSYAHRDIKPWNIAIKGDVVRLIDLGICQVNPEQLPETLHGAPVYLPNINTFLNQEITLKQLDVLALKRVIYMPDKMLCFKGYVEDISDRYFGIFPQVLLHVSGLAAYFDTSATSKTQRVLSEQDFQGNPLMFASLLVLSRYGLMEQYAAKMKSTTLAHAVVGLYFANQGISEARAASQISSIINAYVLRKVVHQYELLAERTKLLASLVATGIINNLYEALENKTLISLIKMPSVLIQRAAALLWQNGFHDDSLLISLNGNDEVAQSVIKLIFDGDLHGVKKVLLPAGPSNSRKPLGGKRLSLPIIPQAKTKDKEFKFKSERALAPRDKDTSARDKISERLPSLFFAFPKKNKKPYANLVEHSYKKPI